MGRYYQLCNSYGSLGGREAYDWYDLVLNGFGEGYYVEEAGEVELGGQFISEVQLVADLSDRGSSQKRPAVPERWSVVPSS